MLPICTKGMLYIGFYVKLFTCIISFNCNSIIRCAPFYLLYRWGNQSVEGFWNLLSSRSGEQESSVKRQCQYFYLVHWPRNMGGTRGCGFLLHSIGGLAQFKEICQDCSRMCPLKKVHQMPSPNPVHAPLTASSVQFSRSVMSNSLQPHGL